MYQKHCVIVSQGITLEKVNQQSGKQFQRPNRSESNGKTGIEEIFKFAGKNIIGPTDMVTGHDRFRKLLCRVEVINEEL